MALMRYIWVESARDGNGALIGRPPVAPDYEKARREGINGFFFDMFVVDRETLQKVKADGFAVGIYMAGNWAEFRGLDGRAVAEKVYERVVELRWSTSRATPKVQFDLEMHDGPLIINCFRRWRELQPTRDTSWTM